MLQQPMKKILFDSLQPPHYKYVDFNSASKDIIIECLSSILPHYDTEMVIMFHKKSLFGF